MPTSNAEELRLFLKCTVIGRGVFTTERSNTTAIWWLMAHSHCTGPGQGQNWETTGFYITLLTVHTSHGQGQGTIVFYCAHIGPSPCPCPCSVYEP